MSPNYTDEIHPAKKSHVFERNISFLSPQPYLVDRVQDKLVETTNIAFTSSLVPFLLFGVEELVTPESLHELGWLDLKLGSVDLSKLLQGEGPAMEPRSKANGSP